MARLAKAAVLGCEMARFAKSRSTREAILAGRANEVGVSEQVCEKAQVEDTKGNVFWGADAVVVVGDPPLNAAWTGGEVRTNKAVSDLV